ncbi:hypothetical protein H0H93_002104 [Arthromyces matolae]|nr:hypothetical protein H0H93_002104 [Arthromyces matolae]
MTIQKPIHQSPLLGCPPGTIYVSNNLSDPFASFRSIQEAIDSLPSARSAIILIAEGDYGENVNVTRDAPLTLLGQIPPTSRVNEPKYSLSSDDNTLLSATSNLVHIFGTNYVHSGNDDATSAVLTVAPSLNASLIGAGPTGAPLQPLRGNCDFRAYNIDWSNRANVILANRGCGGGITAWKGTNLTDAPNNRYGVYVSDSKIIRSPDANSTTVTDGQCSLGRPWNDLATTVYLNTFMDDSIRPSGFTPWGGTRPTILNTTFYAEFNSSGPGGNVTARIPEEHILTAEEAQTFTLETVLGHPSWIDFDYRF